MTTLHHSAPCAICGETLEAGSVVRFHRITKSTIGAKIGGSHTLGERSIMRPRHVHDCLGALAVRQSEEQRQQAIERGIALARERGVPEHEIAQWLADGAQ